MKKLISIVLTLLLFALCTAQAATAPTGMLGFSAATEEEFEAIYQAHMAQHESDGNEYPLTYYDNLTSMLMALQSGDIFMMLTGTSIADYMIARNDGLTLLPGSGLAANSLSYTMMLREDSAELHQKLNAAISALTEDGTLAALIENNLTAYIASGDPEAVTLPVIEGAPTVTVAVTGDLPPMDFVAVDGTPSGFNVALLAAIAEKAQLNIQLITVDTAARLTALSSGRADVVFWSCASICEEHPDYAVNADVPAGVLITEPYYTDSLNLVTLTESLKYLPAAE